MTIPHHYSMKWDNYHSHVGDIFSQLLETGSMADVSLYAEGERINCHKMLLSACSPYFQEILSTAGGSNMIVVVSGIRGEDVRSIIEFVYRGEISVKADRFSSVLKAAEALKICGLMEVSSHLSEMEDSEILSDQRSEGKNKSFKEELNRSMDHTKLVIKEEKKHESVLTSSENTWNCIEMPVQNYNIIDNCKVVNNCTKKENFMTNFSMNDETKQEDVGKELRETDADVLSSNVRSFDLKMETANVIDTPTKMECVANSEEELLCEEMKLKRRKDIRKKLYSEEAMSAALEDMKSGKNLVEAAAKHHVPRTTLYMRARAIGACPAMARKGYPREKITAALESVAGGSSLQCAATAFGIPKTVLWRRVQKEIGSSALPSKRLKPSVPPQVNSKEAVLQEGVSITRVSPQYQIPKATLFRWEKVQLTGDVKIPKSLVKDKSDKDVTYELRLDSSNANSNTKPEFPQDYTSHKFKAAKPAVWNELQSSCSKEVDHHPGILKNENEDTVAAEQLKQQQQSPREHQEEQPGFHFSDVVHELPVSYVNSSQFSDSPLIILAPVESDKYSVKEQKSDEDACPVRNNKVFPSVKVENEANHLDRLKNISD